MFQVGYTWSSMNNNKQKKYAKETWVAEFRENARASAEQIKHKI